MIDGDIPRDAWLVVKQHGREAAPIICQDRSAAAAHSQDGVGAARWVAVERFIRETPVFESMELDFTVWHLTHGRLQPGTTISPGGHGAKVREGRLPSGELEREHRMETVRARLFPLKPSRFACVFAFPSIATARAYQQIYFKHGLLHEVRAVATNVHIGNFLSVVTPSPGCPTRQNKSPNGTGGAT